MENIDVLERQRNANILARELRRRVREARTEPVCYGFLEQGKKTRRGNFGFTALRAFRPLSIAVWGKDGASIKSLSLSGDEQLMLYSPAALFTLSEPEEALADILQLMQTPRPIQESASFFDVRTEIEIRAFNIDLPTLSPGRYFNIEWDGELTAFFVFGLSLAPREDPLFPLGGEQEEHY